MFEAIKQAGLPILRPGYGYVACHFHNTAVVRN